MIPQAVTTRDMTEAYKWLQTLPPSAREELKTMDQVVSLYIRAKRLGVPLPSFDQGSSSLANASENQKSSQDFHKTLKNLQVELQKFDDGSGAIAVKPPIGTINPIPTQNSTPIPSTSQGAQQGQLSMSLPLLHQANSQITAPLPQSTQNVGTEDGHSHNSHGNLLTAMRMDPKSRHIINELREGLNLSSDVEVIRMCLVLAHKSLKELIK